VTSALKREPRSRGPSRAVEVGGGDRAWKAIREAVLARDENMCFQCHVRFESADLDVHHLIPRKQGGADDPANLVALCDGCHAARHPSLQVGLARRILERWAIRVATLVDRDQLVPESAEQLRDVLTALGVKRLREGQLEPILAALRGESLIVIRPTGSGKSVCFQVPALAHAGTALVISPLKALMADQVAALQEKRIPATFINSSLGPSEKDARYALLEKGVFKLLYCAPERFSSQLVRAEEVERISRLRPSFLIIDEAHCIDRWGRAFRPDYARLGELRHRLGNPPVLAFTATAGPRAQDRILTSLGAGDGNVFVSDVDRPNISLVRLSVKSWGQTKRELNPERANIIATMLGNLQVGKAMIFVPTVNVGERLQTLLHGEGVDLPFYHSKMGAQNERDSILGRFTGRLDPPLRAVICTNAFGMGIDVPDVRLVIHWQQPASIEDYLQEFGRAGRDGRAAVAVLFTNARAEDDLFLLDYMAERAVEKAKPNERKELLADIRSESRRMSGLARSTGCFRAELQRELCGERGKPPWALRILDRVFATRERVKQGRFCCDHCAPKWRAKVANGDMSFLR
jgi:ATP-dependent DNA helicase RecQ